MAVYLQKRQMYLVQSEIGTSRARQLRQSFIQFPVKITEVTRKRIDKVTVKIGIDNC